MRFLNWFRKSPSPDFNAGILSLVSQLHRNGYIVMWRDNDHLAVEISVGGGDDSDEFYIHMKDDILKELQSHLKLLLFVKGDDYTDD